MQLRAGRLMRFTSWQPGQWPCWNCSKTCVCERRLKEFPKVQTQRPKLVISQAPTHTFAHTVGILVTQTQQTGHKATHIHTQRSTMDCIWNTQTTCPDKFSPVSTSVPFPLPIPLSTQKKISILKQFLSYRSRTLPCIL